MQLFFGCTNLPEMSRPSTERLLGVCPMKSPPLASLEALGSGLAHQQVV